MSNKEEIISYLKNIKNGGVKFSLDILNDEGEKIGILEPIVDSKIADNSGIVRFIKKWREYYRENFLTQFKVTKEGTKNWLENQVIKQNNKMLFMVKTTGGKLIGHEGVIFFEEDESTCELDNLVKAIDCKIPGIMTYAAKTLIEWLFDHLNMKKIFLKVFSDNLKAQDLYLRCGFSKTKEIGLKREIQKGFLRYVAISKTDNQLPDKILFVMKLKKENFSK
jgi:ribosomal protein S18 acetylase RimI-like enzyme